MQVPDGTRHAVDVAASSDTTLCGIPFDELTSFADTDFEVSLSSDECTECRSRME